MKKLLWSLLLLILVSCSTPRTSRIVIFYGFNFSPFSEKGFLFTPEKYEFRYESIGMINCIVLPERHLENTEDSQYKTDYTQPTIKKWVYEKIQPEEILQIIYEECIKMGADACVNLKYETIEDPLRRETRIHQVSGFAIKRVD